MTGNNSNLNIVNSNAYTKFGQNVSICPEDIERKRNSDTNGGHNYVTNLQK